jgi:hypothetical protein
MALIPVYFTIAGSFQFDNSSATPVAPGTLMKLTAGAGDAAYVAAANTTSGVVGVAADAFLSNMLNPPASGYAADIVINSQGDTTRSQDRISDLFKETLASGLMTVYSGSGTFRTTMYANVTYTLGQPLFSDAYGNVTNVSNAGGKIGIVVGLPLAFPSGVPGTDIDGSISLGTYLTFNLNC